MDYSQITSLDQALFHLPEKWFEYKGNQYFAKSAKIISGVKLVVITNKIPLIMFTYDAKQIVIIETPPEKISFVAISRIRNKIELGIKTLRGILDDEHKIYIHENYLTQNDSIMAQALDKNANAIKGYRLEMGLIRTRGRKKVNRDKVDIEKQRKERSRRDWSTVENETILTRPIGMSLEKIAVLLGRSLSATKTQAVKLNQERKKVI